MAESRERPNGGVARRRRERRMRSWFRHEQQSIRMALATVLHHSYDRVDTPSTALHGARPQPPGPGEGAPKRSSSCTTRKTLKRERGQGQSWTLCRRAGCSGTSWSTESMRALSFRSSMLLCRTWGDQVLELLQKIVTASLVEPVQVIAVPKISLDRSPQRSAVRRTQRIQQLVEVPTEPVGSPRLEVLLEA